jgi:uncharacterized protein
MAIAPKLVNASVMHKRLFPQVNAFSYPISFLALPLNQLDRIKPSMGFAIDRWALLSFRQKDHGPKDGRCLRSWAQQRQSELGLSPEIAEVVLVAMPRVFGYAFKPVSFWLFLDDDGKVRAVLYEVNNTFGETHFYLCQDEEQRPIASNQILTADKVFHVSPFLERSGNYRFRFDFTHDKLAICIDLFDESKNKQLITSLSGKLKPLKSVKAAESLSKYSLSTIAALLLIHWQALKLFVKGAAFVSKPKQLAIRITNNLPSKKKDIVA